MNEPRFLSRSALLLVSLTAAVVAQQPTLVFRGGQLFDAEQAASRPLGQLWIAGDRVLGEKPAATPIPADVEVVDTTGKTLLPGMFDLHVHISVGGGPMTVMVPVAAADNLRSQLHCGVTHVLDLHGDQKTIFDVRDASRADGTMARLYCAGAAFTRPRGHATQFGVAANTIDNAADIDQRMAVLLPNEPDVIKAVVEPGGWGGIGKFPTLDAKLFRVIAERAQQASLPLFSHAWSTQDALLASRNGANALAHGVFIGPVTDELVEAMRAKKTAYVPTLSVVLTSVHCVQKKNPYDRKLVHECVHPDLVAGVLDEATPQSLMASPMVRLGRRQEAVYLRNLKTVFDAGLLVGIGTDAGNPMTLHGPSLLFELGRYVASGMTPGQALQAATLSSARILRVDDQFGSLANGKVADVVIVDGDPVADIDAIWQIEQVYKAGAKADRSVVRAHIARQNRPAVTKVAGADALPAMLDDFADGDAESNWGGNWVLTTDSIAGGDSTGKLDVVAVDEGHALRVRGELKKGFRWGPWSGATVQWDPAAKVLVDASQFTGLLLKVKASKRSFTVTCHRAAVKDFNFWTATFEGTGEWQDVRIPFERFRQIGFGKRLEWSASDLKGLQIEARNSPIGGATGPFELEIGSVGLYR